MVCRCGRWGKWFLKPSQRLQQHSGTTFSARQVQSPGCPFSLPCSLNAVASLPQCPLCGQCATSCHPPPRGHAQSMRQLANTSSSIYTHICSTCARSLTHTHIHTQSTWDILCSSCALLQQCVCVSGWQRSLTPTLLPRCSEPQLELAVIGFSNSRSRGVKLSRRLLQQVLQTRLGSNSCWLGTGIFWSQQLAQNTLPQFLQGGTQSSHCRSLAHSPFTPTFTMCPFRIVFANDSVIIQRWKKYTSSR